MDDFDDIQCEDYYYDPREDSYWDDGVEDPAYLVTGTHPADCERDDSF
jgi:hypothetical protein